MLKHVAWSVENMYEHRNKTMLKGTYNIDNAKLFIILLYPPPVTYIFWKLVRVAREVPFSTLLFSLLWYAVSLYVFRSCFFWEQGLPQIIRWIVQGIVEFLKVLDSLKDVMVCDRTYWFPYVIQWCVAEAIEFLQQFSGLWQKALNALSNSMVCSRNYRTP